jgi:hypothetical protein
MRGICRTIFTGADNESFDIARVMWACAAFALFLFQGYAMMFHGLVFSPMEFAGAFATISAGHGVALKLKSETEPK